MHRHHFLCATRYPGIRPNFYVVYRYTITRVIFCYSQQWTSTFHRWTRMNWRNLQIFNGNVHGDDFVWYQLLWMCMLTITRLIYLRYCLVWHCSWVVDQSVWIPPGTRPLAWLPCHEETSPRTSGVSSQWGWTMTSPALGILPYNIPPRYKSPPFWLPDRKLIFFYTS